MWITSNTHAASGLPPERQNPQYHARLLQACKGACFRGAEVAKRISCATIWARPLGSATNELCRDILNEAGHQFRDLSPDL
jgi:hypothetical protein